MVVLYIYSGVFGVQNGDLTITVPRVLIRTDKSTHLRKNTNVAHSPLISYYYTCMFEEYILIKSIYKKIV